MYGNHFFSMYFHCNKRILPEGVYRRVGEKVELQSIVVRIYPFFFSLSLSPFHIIIATRESHMNLAIINGQAICFSYSFFFACLACPACILGIFGGVGEENH